MQIIIILIGLFSWNNAMAVAEPVLNVSMQSIELEKITQLGEIDIKGVGKVYLTAYRSGMQVVVKAVRADQILLGRAETTIGLMETYVYLRTPDGLKKVTIAWGK